MRGVKAGTEIFTSKVEISGYWVVAIGYSQQEADENASRAADAVRANRPELGFRASPKDGSQPERTIIRIDRAKGTVRFEGEDFERPWAECCFGRGPR